MSKSHGGETELHKRELHYATRVVEEVDAQQPRRLLFGGVMRWLGDSDVAESLSVRELGIQQLLRFKGEEKFRGKE